MRKVMRTIGLLALDISSAIVLTLGSILLSLPIVLHLTLGADNDAYIEIGEWIGSKPNILSYFSMEWMFRIDFLLWLALLVIVGLGLRGLLWILLARRAATSPSLPADPTNPGANSRAGRWMLIGFMALCVAAVVFAKLFAYYGRR